MDTQSVVDTLTCIDDRNGDDCTGSVEYRESLSGTGRAIPRCNGHWRKRLDLQEGINRRYGHPDSSTPPAGFDPTYAGESWDED